MEPIALKQSWNFRPPHFSRNVIIKIWNAYIHFAPSTMSGKRASLGFTTGTIINALSAGFLMEKLHTQTLDRLCIWFHCLWSTEILIIITVIPPVTAKKWWKFSIQHVLVFLKHTLWEEATKMVVTQLCQMLINWRTCSEFQHCFYLGFKVLQNASVSTSLNCINHRTVES